MNRKEAIEKVRRMSLPKETMEILEALAPELRESEDERIRTVLCDIVRDMPYMETELRAHGLTVEKTLAYLEKQKDASKAIEAVDRIDKYIDEHLANAHDMKDSNPDKKYYRGWDDALGKMAGILQDVYSGEKQKEKSEKPIIPEQKPQDQCVDVIKMSALLAADRLASAEMTGRLKERKEILENPEKYGLCKPAEWSEEDEKIITRLIGYFESFRIAGVTTKWEGLDIQEVITLLKSLRPQPKQEWNEEDEKLLNYAISMTDDAQVKRFLESLRPSWKPSEEQMETLERWLLDNEFKGDSRYVYPIFESLYNDLKKLM